MDLNKLKKYNFKNSCKDQLLKIAEEVYEFTIEACNGSRERQIEEGLDIITATLNYLNKIGMTTAEYEKHIAKLKRYKSGKYGGNQNT